MQHISYIQKKIFLCVLIEIIVYKSKKKLFGQYMYFFARFFFYFLLQYKNTELTLK